MSLGGRAVSRTAADAATRGLRPRPGKPLLPHRPPSEPRGDWEREEQEERSDQHDKQREGEHLSGCVGVLLHVGRLRPEQGDIVWTIRLGLRLGEGLAREEVPVGEVEDALVQGGSAL
jgi:hypothetical protein